MNIIDWCMNQCVNMCVPAFVCVIHELLLLPPPVSLGLWNDVYAELGGYCDSSRPAGGKTTPLHSSRWGRNSLNRQLHRRHSTDRMSSVHASTKNQQRSRLFGEPQRNQQDLFYTSVFVLTILPHVKSHPLFLSTASKFSAVDWVNVLRFFFSDNAKKKPFVKKKTQSCYSHLPFLDILDSVGLWELHTGWMSHLSLLVKQGKCVCLKKLGTRTVKKVRHQKDPSCLPLMEVVLT